VWYSGEAVNGSSIAEAAIPATTPAATAVTTSASGTRIERGEPTLKKHKVEQWDSEILQNAGEESPGRTSPAEKPADTSSSAEGAPRLGQAYDVSDDGGDENDDVASSDENAGEKPGYTGEPDDFAVNDGYEDDKARAPYSNRGRTDLVLRALCKYTDRQIGKGVDQWLPNPCFEMFVRGQIKEGQDPEVFLQSAEDFASDIRNTELYGLLAENDPELVALDDRSLSAFCVGDEKSAKGIYADLYWSWCRDDAAQGTCTWHCRKCGCCQDWREWHCKRCNKCVYGVSIPCESCRPLDYAKRMRW
jgi:hypothetical protein